jgi:hypothetical protein
MAGFQFQSYARFMLMESSPLTPQIPEASRQCTPDEIKKYKEDGYVLLRQLISPEAAGELRREVLEIMDVIGLGTTKLRQTWQYLKGSALDAYVNGTLQQSVASQLMEGRAILYLPFTAVKSGGGGGQFHFHQDNNYTRHFGPSINLWTALVPMTPENGCLRVVPRSHLEGDWESENAGDGDAHRKVSRDAAASSVPVLMEAGDVVAFSRLTVHGSGANTTPDHRVAYATQFHREDTEALVDGKRVLLRDHPRFTDIHGVDRISDGGKRDGH